MDYSNERSSNQVLSGIYEPDRFMFSRVFFKECSVAGLSFHVERNDELWDELSVGTKIALVRDRCNKHDRNAVAIALADDFDGEPDNFDFDFILGYVPRNENEAIATMLDAGYFDKFDVEITTLKRHGKLEERIRITIWLTTLKPVRVRPNLLRADYLNSQEFMYLLESLKERGVGYLRWGGFPRDDRNMPVKGERIVIYTTIFGRAYMYYMTVLALGDDCEVYFDDPAIIRCTDDCVPYILGNIAGPIIVNVNELSFIPERDLERISVYHYLAEPISNSLTQLFKNHLRTLSPDNIDADPSIDESNKPK